MDNENNDGVHTDTYWANMKSWANAGMVALDDHII